MYTPTDWPKNGISTGHIEFSVKFHSNQYALALHSLQHSWQRLIHYRELLSAIYTKFLQTNQPHLPGGGQIRRKSDKRIKSAPVSLYEPSVGLPCTINGRYSFIRLFTYGGTTPRANLERRGQPGLAKRSKRGHLMQRSLHCNPNALSVHMRYWFEVHKQRNDRTPETTQGSQGGTFSTKLFARREDLQTPIKIFPPKPSKAAKENNPFSPRRHFLPILFYVAPQQLRDHPLLLLSVYITNSQSPQIQRLHCPA